MGQVYREIVQVQNLIKTTEGKIDDVTNVIVDKIDNKIDDVTSAMETRVNQLEQLMQRGHQGVVAQVTAQLEAKLNRQTWLLRVSFALVFALVVGIIVGMQMSIWMQGENKATCLRPLVAYGRLHCQVIDDGPSDVEHIADGMQDLWNYTQHFNYSEWVTKFNTPP